MNNSGPLLYLYVEGDTEREFVQTVLRDLLYEWGYRWVAPIFLSNSRQKENRGGIRNWTTVRKGIINRLKTSSRAVVTTMVDYYGLHPRQGPNAWPGCHPEIGKMSTAQRAEDICAALSADVLAKAGSHAASRFIPYVSMHEIEGLWFSDCQGLARAAKQIDMASELQAVRDQFASPEDINDTSHGAPSKRLDALLCVNSKVTLGADAAKEIEFRRIREECHVFNRWMEQLEQWPKEHRMT